MPWDVIPWDPTVHLGLFVHRVDGLKPGLYLLVRDPRRMGRLSAAMHARFEWSMPPGCPAELPLRLLEAGDVRRLATQVSCHQDIAGDGAFSLAMIAEYQETLFTRGAWFYRRLFWETGLIGQVLYLEAEAAGVRATGIGCFFDDPVHSVFGLEDLAFQSLYHFSSAGRSTTPPDDAGTVRRPGRGAPRHRPGLIDEVRTRTSTAMTVAATFRFYAELNDLLAPSGAGTNSPAAACARRRPNT
jgi:hypothetical protein